MLTEIRKQNMQIKYKVHNSRFYATMFFLHVSGVPLHWIKSTEKRMTEPFLDSTSRSGYLKSCV